MALGLRLLRRVQCSHESISLCMYAFHFCCTAHVQRDEDEQTTRYSTDFCDSHCDHHGCLVTCLNSKIGQLTHNVEYRSADFSHRQPRVDHRIEYSSELYLWSHNNTPSCVYRSWCVRFELCLTTAVHGHQSRRCVFHCCSTFRHWSTSGSSDGQLRRKYGEHFPRQWWWHLSRERVRVRV